MKHFNKEIEAITKFFTPSARQGFGHRYTDDQSASCEAPKKRQGFSPCIPEKIMIVFYYWV
ncbi:MAG: hypothetical protein F6K23_37095 [Okeania sp. SIO2C9]|uniref:hypothetical protein n=1 Tax=Okeania sp. SIO2C9 TaxID=2607791 RepID=UPI0013C10D9E|nr:hypothetical protein [Okeania sp. SIO2C9]NEQ78120.1 hypothetical protein [Okeania sp. SIO2C9]